MSDELIIDMTRKEAMEMDSIARVSETTKRIAVYLIHLRNGWKSLNYNSFDDYCEERIDTARRPAYDWIDQVQATADAHGLTLNDLCTLCTNEKGELLPTTVTREMKKLPAPVRREAWQQYEAISAQGGTGDHGLKRDLTRQLKNIVAQKLNLLKGDSSPVSQPSQTMPAPSAFDSAAETKQPEQTASAPTPTPAPKTPAAATVKTYTPAPDPEPAELFTLDFENAADVLNTCLTWIQNQEIDGDSKAMKWAIGSLREVQCWIEAQL